MGADRTQDDLLGPRCALGYLSRRHTAWFDLTDDDGRSTGQQGKGGERQAQSRRIHVFVPPGHGGRNAISISNPL